MVIIPLILAIVGIIIYPYLVEEAFGQQFLAITLMAIIYAIISSVDP